METRICPAKHGIAVSLRLVDTTAASRLVKVKQTETERKPIGWVTPNMWDSRFTGSDANSKTTKTNTASSKCIAANENTTVIKRNENVGQEHSNRSRSGRTGDAAAEGDYIDIFQASMLFSRAHSGKGEEQMSEEHKQIQRQPQMHPHAQAELQGRAQRQPITETPPQAHVSLSTNPPTHTNVSSHDTALHYSQVQYNHNDSPEASQCVRTVRFSEKPCTPCTSRRQVRNISKEQDTRCRYRESYQAAIQNPVNFGQEKIKSGLLALVEEDGDFLQCDEGQMETGDPWSNVQAMRDSSEILQQFPSSVCVAPCKESDEKRTVPYWKAGDLDSATSTEDRGTHALENSGLPEQTPESTQHCLHNVAGSHSEAETQKNTNTALSSPDPKQSNEISARRELSGMKVPLKPPKGLQNRASSVGKSPNVAKIPTAPQSRRESMSDRRCSSLSTTVVETSENCEVVIVEGQKVRRRENTGLSAEIPQLHVVKCKNSTAFGLVSPKVYRRRVVPGTLLRCLATQYYLSALLY